MLRVADLVTNPSQEYVQQREMAMAAQGKQLMDSNGANGAVTSADIRQIKMNYLQHNKNQLPHTGPIMPKNMEGVKTGSQATL